MSSPRHSRALALVLSIVPGWGHVYIGLERAGLTLFTLAALGAFLCLNLVLLYHGENRLLLARSAAGAGALVWLVSLADAWRRTSPRRRRRIEEEKGRMLREGMIAYLKGDLEAADEAFRSCLWLDAQEVEALMRLGVVAARKGDLRRAARLLRRARKLDLEEKWRWEIGRELQALHEASHENGRAPAGPGAGLGKKAGRSGAAAEAPAESGPGAAAAVPVSEVQS